MHFFNTALNDTTEINRTTPVRVQCEAQDCRALLELLRCAPNSDCTSPSSTKTRLVCRRSMWVLDRERTDRLSSVAEAVNGLFDSQCESGLTVVVLLRLLEVDLAQASLTSLNQRHHSSNVFTGDSTASGTALLRGDGDGLRLVSTGEQSLGTRFNNGAPGSSELRFTNAPKLRPQEFLQPPPLSRYSLFHQQTPVEPVRDLFSWYHPSNNHRSFISSPVDPFTSPECKYGAAALEKTKVKKQKASRVRHPSPYNMFMSQEVKRIKAMDPSLDHKEAFKMAASNWAKSPHNCSNRRMPSPFQPSSTISAPVHDFEAGITPVEHNLATQRPEFDSKIAMSNFKRRAVDYSLEDSASSEEKRRKTDLGFLEPSKESNVLSDMITEGEVA